MNGTGEKHELGSNRDPVKGIHASDRGPLGGDTPGLFEKLTLSGHQRVFAITSSGGNLDRAARGVAIHRHEAHAVVLVERDDKNCRVPHLHDPVNSRACGTMNVVFSNPDPAVAIDLAGVFCAPCHDRQRRGLPEPNARDHLWRPIQTRCARYP